MSRKKQWSLDPYSDNAVIYSDDVSVYIVFTPTYASGDEEKRKKIKAKMVRVLNKGWNIKKKEIGGGPCTNKRF